jgi:hypothetical protein
VDFIPVQEGKKEGEREVGMKPKILRLERTRPSGIAIAIACAVLLLPGNVPGFARQVQQTTADQTAKIPPDQLDSLVAPIALYPDPLLSQTLVASTYPLEIMQLQQWLTRNKGLQGQALADAVSKQPWDPSIQAMAALPEVVSRLANDIQWTTDLGNAFLAQQSDVMSAVQRMRAKAQDTGALASNKQQKVENEVIDNRSVIVVEQADPQVVYVPSYNPVDVYGPPVYPYPPIYYPYSTGAAVAASAISFGAGVALGAAWGGGWGWNAGWGHNDIDVNFNNSFNRRYENISGNRRGDNVWRHNPQHRGGTPYADRATANRFASGARGDSLVNRQKSAQQQIARQGGNLGSVTERRPGARGDLGGAGRGNIGDRGGIPGGGVNRGNIGGGNVGGGNFNRGDRVGNRNLGSSSSFGRNGGFSGGSGGFSGFEARSSRSRGSSSFSRPSGGGFGGRSGGGARRGGGGGRRR